MPAGSWTRLLGHHFEPYLVPVTLQVRELNPRHNLENDDNRQKGFLTLVMLSSEPKASQNPGLEQMSQ